ncbi:MAG: hypothetical protein IJ861_05135 [Clostridia bacterium]|nr:hypothetical protein [Clostridia bacterium]
MSDPVSEPEKLERMAKNGDAPPQNLTFSGKLYYLSMVQLYSLFYNHIYTREQAKEIKAGLIEDYKNNLFKEKLLDYHAGINNRCSHILTEAEKSGCPICKKLVRIFDGRE